MLYIIEYNEVQDLRPEALNELVPCPKSDSFGTPPAIRLLAIPMFAFVSRRMNSRSPKTFRSRSVTSGALVTLLLALSGKAGTAGRPATVAEKASPLPLDSVGLGHTEAGETILQLGIGQTTLALAMPTNATEKLGQALLAMTASTSHGAN